MSKKTIKIIKSTAVPMYLENIDTDQIYPARFLRTTTKEGLANMLFHDWRFNPDGTKKAESILNDPNYKGEILVVGKNFGCGSSREHAAWALSQYGFNAVVSSSFGDIFKHNALNNSLLPVEVTEKFLKIIFDAIEHEPKTILEVDLQNQTISLTSKKMSEKFEIDLYKKECLMKGYDDIDYILSMKENIEEFEKNRKNDYSILV